MAINLDLLKKKLTQLETANQKGEKVDVLWKAEAGTSIIRIVPYQFDKENPFIELKFHYEFGKQMLSPSTFGRPDPIVDFASKLKSTGKKEDWSLGRKIEPKMRIYVPIIVRGREAEGVKFWGFGNTVYKELLGYLADPDYGDITDPVSGRDITIEFKTKEQTGKDFPETSLRIKPATSPVSTDKAIIQKIASGQKNITEVFKEPTYAELEAALHKFLDADGTGSVASDVTGTASIVDETPAKSNVGKKNTTSSKPNSTSTVTDVASAFDALFKNN